RIVETKERARDVLFAHLVGCTLLGIYGLGTGRFVRDRLDGVGGPGMDDANTLGMYFATGVIVAAGMVITQRDWRRWVSFAALAIVGNGLVLTNTRGAVLGLVAGAFVLFLTKSRLYSRAFWLLCVACVFGAMLVVDQKFVERMSTLSEAWSDSSEIDDSALSRLALLDAQFKMFQDYRLGTGHRGTEALSTKYLDKQWLSQDDQGVEGTRSSHNTFMTALVEQGVPGAVLFVWLALWTVVTLLRSGAKEALHGDPELTTLIATIGGALAVIFVAGNTADFLMAEVQFWLFAVLVSTLQFARTRRAQQADAEARPSPTGGAQQRAG
ncbi:MAG: O-antigen ligase family protein, partial [Burkholderiaceae bacterium]